MQTPGNQTPGMQTPGRRWPMIGPANRRRNQPIRLRPRQPGSKFARTDAAEQRGTVRPAGITCDRDGHRGSV